MCGLPQDTLSFDLYSAQQARKLGDFVRIYPVLVLKETPLEVLYQTGEYVPLSLEEAVERTAQMKEVLSPVPVIRTGLCTEDLKESDVAAGPIHPAFGELVDGRIYDKKVRGFLSEQKTEGRTLVIVAPKQEQSKLSGHKKSNLIGWKRDYHLNRIHFSDSKTLSFSLEKE